MTDVKVLAAGPDTGKALVEATGAEAEVWRTSLNAGCVLVPGKPFKEIKDGLTIRVVDPHAEKLPVQSVLLSKVTLNIRSILHLQAKNLLMNEMLHRSAGARASRHHEP